MREGRCARIVAIELDREVRRCQDVFHVEKDAQDDLAHHPEHEEDETPGNHVPEDAHLPEKLPVEQSRQLTRRRGFQLYYLACNGYRVITDSLQNDIHPYNR